MKLHGRPVFPPGISIFLTPWFPVNVFQVDLQLLCYFVPVPFYLRAIVELYPPKLECLICMVSEHLKTSLIDSFRQ